MYLRLLLVSLFILGAGCSSRKVLSEDNSVTSKKAVKVWANWVKDKGKKFDIQFAIENIHKEAIIVKLGDIQCARGKRSGSLKHTFFNTGERTMDFQPGQIKMFNLVCNIGVKSEGPFNMRINRVFSNPEGDGKTTDKVIAKGIVWSYTEK